GPCLVVPFSGADSTRLGYARLKPDRPQSGRNGKPKKYEAPRGGGNQAYLPPRTRAALNDPAVPLLLVEGEKKAAKADQDGFACGGISGVWNWCQKRDRRPDGTRRGKVRLIPSLAQVAWHGRRVDLVFDSDVATNASVRLARYRLAVALAKRGAVVRAVDL